MMRALAFGLVAFIAGCTFGGRPSTPLTTYVLTAAAAPATTLPTTGNAMAPVLKVATPTAAPAYASSRIAYIEQPYRIDYFAENQWADAPARMLKNLLTQDLAESGLFRFVHADSGGVDDGLRLDSNIVELVQTFSPTASEVRVTIRFDLVDVPHRTVLFSEAIQAIQPTTARDPYAGVVAANLAMRQVLDRLRERIRVALASAPSVDTTASD